MIWKHTWLSMWVCRRWRGCLAWWTCVVIQTFIRPFVKQLDDHLYCCVILRTPKLNIAWRVRARANIDGKLFSSWYSSHATAWKFSISLGTGIFTIWRIVMDFKSQALAKKHSISNASCIFFSALKILGACNLTIYLSCEESQNFNCKEIMGISDRPTAAKALFLH